MKKSPVIVIVLVVSVALFTLISGASPASGNLCPIRDGEVVCTSDEKTYDSKRACLRECVPGQSEETREGLCVEAAGRVECITGNPRTDFGSDFDECVLRCMPEESGGGPDLQVQSLVTEAAWPHPYEKNRFNAHLVIKNQGDRTTRESKLSIFINSSDGWRTQTVCSGESDIHPIQPGRSILTTRNLRKAKSSRDCILDRGNYILAVLVGNHVFTRDFSFGTDSENPSLVCPILDSDSPYPYSLVSKHVGFRTYPELYCDLTGVLSQQKPVKSECVNSFECRSNLCAAGVCVTERQLNLALAQIIN